MYRYVVLIALVCISLAARSKENIGPRDVDALPTTPPTLIEQYGTDPLQFGELRLPAGKGPFPVAVIIHGGCWLEKFATLRNLAPVASELPRLGIATWNIEYRRNDNGGGWPATFTDVGLAVDHLRHLSEKHPLDLSKVVVIGHSAGAPLAVWAAGRTNLPHGSLIRGTDPLRVKAAVAIDGPLDLAQFIGIDAEVCGQSVIVPLLGGTPDDKRDNYRQASPADMLPIGVPVYLVRSGLVSQSEAEAYEAKARSAGDRVMIVPVPGANHFHVIAPNETLFWPVREAIQAAVHNIP